MMIDALETVRQLLPFWAVWGPMASAYVVVFLATMLVMRLALEFPGRHVRRALADPDVHWTECARLA